MKFARPAVLKHRQTPIVIDENIDLKAVVAQRFSDVILSLGQLHLQGELRALENDDIRLTLQVTGEVTVPSSRSLAPVKLPVDMDLAETYVTTEKHLEDFEDNEAVFLLENDVIDVDEVILENLVASLPTQVLTQAEAEEDQYPTGNGWQVISQDDYEVAEKDEEPALDPRLQKLDQFFDK
ncbi:DUF177 domain-containing protein [Leuconostocaceae bacterium ESL0723]|nr:DUF177 domain-containing protein [Leuconostocaceae bacterium ESL0723]